MVAIGPRALRLAVAIAALSLVYAAAARLGLMLGAVSVFATLVWAPSGISLAALLLLGDRVLAGVWLGAFVVNVWTGAPLGVAFGIASGNTLEAWAGAYALRHLGGFAGSFDRLRHVIVLVVPAATMSTLISATIGVSCLCLGGFVAASSFLETWRAWWVGDMLGDLVVAPVLLAWATSDYAKPTAIRAAEGLLLGGVLVAASLLIFFTPASGASYPFAYPYVLFPIFIWAALRFELRGAATVTAVASALAIWGTVRGRGPFVRETLAHGLLALQTFMGCAALTPLVVAGAISDRGRALRTRETFLATVSHDLKNPLHAIQMSAVTLAKALPDTSAARIEKHAKLVQNSVDRMTRLIADLLDAAAIDAGRLSVEPREVSARALANEAVEMLRPLVTPRGQTLRVARAEDLLVVCDRSRVLQVLSNLIGNAIKFSHDGGDIEVGVEGGSRSARFWVRDYGVGIDPVQLGHVFERYWSTRPAGGGGTGLGLFVAKGIVEAHGGTLWADSKVGAGSTFQFTLPVAGRSPSRKAAA